MRVMPFNITKLPVLLVYKHSRYAFILEQGSDDEKRTLFDINNVVAHELKLAHEKNLACIDAVQKILRDLQIDFRLMCRSDIKDNDLQNHFVITVGGDGTLLDCSHYIIDSPILGVNSDPTSSIGALCAANINNFREIFLAIRARKLLPTPINRLQISINGEKVAPLATNDLLFCHENAASLSRFSLKQGIHHEHHRSSGLWIATAAGSTGGIYSAGGRPLRLDSQKAIFRMREPYWSNPAYPKLLDGVISPHLSLQIISEMMDAEIYIDGAHKRRSIAFGDMIDVGLADQLLWLFDGPTLTANRQRIIEQRETVKLLWLHNDNVKP